MSTTPKPPEIKTPTSPAKMWRDLKADILDQIHQLDEITPGGPVEPDWWLEMMSVQRLLRETL